MNTIRRFRRRQAERLERQYTTKWVAAQRDRGAVLPLVLVMIIVGALIVIPVTMYTTAVVRANRVEEQKTRSSETARGAIRVALHSPSLVFGDDDRADDGCPDDVSELIPDGVMTETGVSLSCVHVDELSADEVFGLEVPVGLAQLQIAPDPAGLDRYSGVIATSGGAPPYADSGFEPSWAWWLGFDSGTVGDPKTVAPLPELPSFSGVERTSDPIDMPGFDCKVFLPGHYTDPLVIDGSFGVSNFYFASGVYYFDQPISISGDIDIVVGQGLADFGVTNDCADDIQVGAHADVPLGTTYGIDGNTGGATWVLGGNARIAISESGGAPSVRFNQRYAENEGGAWTNIISVNGDWSYADGDPDNDDEFEDADGDHSVTNVNYVPRSQVISGETVVPLYLSDTPYVPSHPSLTDEARVPDAPSGVVAVAATRDVSGSDDGAVIVSFEGVEGADTNGAIVDDYEVGIATSSGGDPAVECSVQTNTVWPTFEGADGTTPWGDPSGENAADPDGYSCMITGLPENATYWVSARAHSEVGWGAWSTRAEVLVSSASPTATPPVSASNITIESYDTDDAIVSWDPAIDTAQAPVQAYEVTVYRVSDVRIDSIVPDTGLETGGLPVVISGSGFTSATVADVTFGGLSANSFSVVSDTEITAVTPPHAPGGVDVVVDFGSSVSGSATFNYQPLAVVVPGWPVVTGISPGNGPEAGGDTIALTGTDLDTVTAVTFGTSGAAIVGQTPTSLTVTAPAGAGTVPVSVTNPIGTSSPVAYTYDPPVPVPPSVSGVGPSSGPQVGGNTVTLTGASFGDASTVTFGG
ncbi:MAG: IPT/TIG domain-containing protein, partial [Ilumatobacter sp.]|nr:IPT/TIG domain-containing protein [Ilumatobacter sp.]